MNQVLLLFHHYLELKAKDYHHNNLDSADHNTASLNLNCDIAQQDQHAH